MNKNTGKNSRVKGEAGKTSSRTLASISFSKRKKTIALLSMVAPVALWLIALRYLPMAGIIMAFKTYKINPDNPTFIGNLMYSKWCGIDNFKFLFITESAVIMFRNTLLYNIVFIILGMIIPVTLAIMMNELTKKFAAKAYQTMMFFPYFLSWVVVSYFLNAFLNPQFGMLTSAQRLAGETVTRWYTTPKPWPYILVGMNLWKNTGYSTVLYLAAITGIDASQYEAAAIDGATKWQQVLYVTLPHLKTMIIILFIMNVGKIFNADFGLFYNVPMNNGALTSVTTVIDTYVYNTFVALHDSSRSSAAGLLQNVVGFICIMTANSIVKKIEPESSLF